MTVAVLPSSRRAKPATVARREKTFAEFFAGIGLVRLALEAEGWAARFANDIDPDKFSIYEKNFPSHDFTLRDINKVHGRDLPSITLAAASFPCTDLSLAGERQGLNGSESGTIWGFLRIIREMGKERPPIISLENVTGFLSSHNGQDFRSVIRALNNLGYACDALVLDAVRFVPQSRPRLFIVAFGQNIDLAYANVSHAGHLIDHPSRPEQLIWALRENDDLNWRFANSLPSLPFNSTPLADILEVIPPDSELWWDSLRVKKLIGQMNERHKTILDHLINKPRKSFGTIYKRMRDDRIRAEIRHDGIAGCLRTPRGGSSKQIVFEAGRGNLRIRHMTPREYARLQGVPDDFRIDVPANKALFGFGDAVCVPAVRWLARNLINPIFNSL